MLFVVVFFVVSCFCCWVVAFLMSFFFFSRCPFCMVVVLLLPGEVRFRAGGVSLPLCVPFPLLRYQFTVFFLSSSPACILFICLLIFFPLSFFPFRVGFSPFLYVLVCSHMISCRILIKFHCFRLFVSRPMWWFPFLGSTCIYACVTALLTPPAHVDRLVFLYFKIFVSFVPHTSCFSLSIFF